MSKRSHISTADNWCMIKYWLITYLWHNEYVLCPEKCYKLPQYGNRPYLFSFKLAYSYGVSTDSRDITHDMLKYIAEHAVVLQYHLH